MIYMDPYISGPIFQVSINKYGKAAQSNVGPYISRIILEGSLRAIIQLTRVPPTHRHRTKLHSLLHFNARKHRKLSRSLKNFNS